jgi:hypothetical protein
MEKIMSTLFRPRPGHFEKKSQSLPNCIFFNENLTEPGVRLIGVLNAMMTCGGNWVPSQSDIQNRLGWGIEKMQKAIKNLVDNGYLKVTMIRSSDALKKGQFARNILEFDIDGAYLIYNPEVTSPESEKASHKHSEPIRGYPLPGEPVPANPMLPCSFVESTYIKEQTEQGAQETRGADCGKTESDKDDVVVVLSNDYLEKRDMLVPYGFSAGVLKTLTGVPLAQIQDALKAYAQYAKSRSEKGQCVANPAGVVRKAITEKWKPNTSKAESIASAAAAYEAVAKKQRNLIDENRSYAEKVIEQHKEYFNNEFSVTMSDRVILLKSEGGLSPLGLNEDFFIDYLNFYLSSHKICFEPKK